MKSGSIRWLWDVSGRKKLYIAALSLLQMLLGASGVFYALLLRNIVDCAVAGDSAGFWRNTAFTVVLIAVQLILAALIRALNERCRASLENVFKQRLLDELLRRDLSSVTAIHSGEWLNRLTSDSAVVAGNMTDILPALLGMAVKLISAMAMLIILEPRFALLILVGGAVLLVATAVFRSRLKQLHKQVQESDGRLRVFLQERLGSLLMIRSFAAEARTMDESRQVMDDFWNARISRNRFSNLCNVGFGAAMSGMYLLGVCWCAYGILTHRMSFGTLTAITQLIGQIQAPFANLTGVVPRYYSMIASAERLREAEALPDRSEATIPLSSVLQFYRERFAALVLDGVSYAYYPPAEKPGELDKSSMPLALNDLHLRLSKGEITALTGPSGCGKSTALKLLMGVYPPDEGMVLLQDKEGNTEPVSEAWRRLFAYVPQGNLLMRGTIREAVSFGNPALSDDDTAIRSALVVACADAFVSELENGLDTPLGERGAGLSEGQMQRLAVARAVFSESPILLLDEATSALDAETEKQLLENIRGMTDRSVLIVTHRPAALSICDKVLRFTEEGVTEA